MQDKGKGGIQVGIAKHLLKAANEKQESCCRPELFSNVVDLTVCCFGGHLSCTGSHVHLVDCGFGKALKKYQ